MDFENTPFKGPINPENIINAGKKNLPEIIKYAPFAIAALLIIIFLVSGLYSVGPDEVGVVRRFGQYTRTTNPGLHIKIPFGVEKVDKVKVKYIFKEEFGFRTLKSGIVSSYSYKTSNFVRISYAYRRPKRYYRGMDCSVQGEGPC